MTLLQQIYYDLFPVIVQAIVNACNNITTELSEEIIQLP